ncbi:hypothetical protein ACFSUD_11065 [Sulfitobacter aestuarii]|uniref:Uncharacterized protein n=1 Tax=Sulfitobacter aestuarii TaxID=2161676 RepID=A0ABW5U2Q8_9RHOB
MAEASDLASDLMPSDMMPSDMAKTAASIRRTAPRERAAPLRWLELLEVSRDADTNCTAELARLLDHARRLA